MKGKFSSIWRVALALVLALSLGLVTVVPAMAIDTVDLGSAANFAVLGGTGITNTGATSITGDVGSHPTATITGFETVTLDGTNHAGDEVTQAAKDDLVDAYNDAANRTPTTSYDPIFDLGGLTLTPGVYYEPSSLGITGTLTLDAQNDPNAVFIFQVGSTLTTAAGNSTVSLINQAQASNVFWQVGSSATLGTNTTFKGNILALASITINTGATMEGRALARDAKVTLQANTIAVPIIEGVPPIPEPSTIILTLVGLGAVALAFVLVNRRTRAARGR